MLTNSLTNFWDVGQQDDQNCGAADNHLVANLIKPLQS